MVDMAIEMDGGSISRLLGCHVQHSLMRGPVKDGLVLKGANGPSSPAAGDVLAEHGILVVPDVICNGGGVAVSNFEWTQNFSSFFWTEDEVDLLLDRIMAGALKQLWEAADRHNITLHTAAFTVPCERVLNAREERGLYP